MPIYGAPVPNIKDVFWAFFSYHSPPKNEFDFGRGFQPILYNLGRWALYDAVVNLAGKDGCIWVPSYFCEETLIPLRSNQIKIHFYPVEERLAPDFDYIQRNLKDQTLPTCFLLVHYFGFPNCTEESYRFCIENNLILIEDAAHVLELGPGEIGSRGEAIILSPRKLLAVPEGGLLLLRTYKKIPPPQAAPFPYRWVAKNLVKEFLRFLGIGNGLVASKRQNNLKKYDTDKFESSGIKTLGPFATHILIRAFKDIEPAREKRYRNYQRLIQLLKETSHEELIFRKDLPAGCTPYALILRDKNQNTMITRLQRFGIPAYSWPTLPPEVLGNSKYEMANQLKQSLIFLPCHQDLTEAECVRIIDVICNKL